MIVMTMETEARFDRVVIFDQEGRRELSQYEFLKLPLSQRIRCVIERTATFYLGIEEVDRHSAINALRKTEAG
jgi:hypothetical protein